MNESLKNIHQLRSVRSFTDRQINQEDLDAILEASIRAANASSRQSYSIIVLKDVEKIKAVCGYKGSVALVYCVDNNRLLDIANYMNQSYEISPTIGYITASTDTILAAQTAVIAAKSLGIDSLITNGVHRQDLENTYELLKLPSEYCFPLIVIVLGYAKNEENPEKGRVKTGVIHYDEYHHLSTKEIEEEISMFDTNEHKYGLASYTQCQSMDFKHYYEWFFQVWTGKEEDKFLPVLKDKKFFI